MRKWQSGQCCLACAGTLQTHRLEHKLCTMFKTVHNLISFPPILVPQHSRIGYNAYLQPFAHTNSFLYFFVPSTISLWNSLPSNVTSTPTLAIFEARPPKVIYIAEGGQLPVSVALSIGYQGRGLCFCHLKCMIFQVVAVHLVRDLYYFRGKASKYSIKVYFIRPDSP